jgi:hypothetical protein
MSMVTVGLSGMKGMKKKESAHTGLEIAMAIKEIRRMWQQVKARQQAYADSLWAIVETEIAKAKAAGLPSFGNAAAVPNEIKIAKANWKPWAEFANKSGQNRNANDAIRNARSKNTYSDIYQRSR